MALRALATVLLVELLPMRPLLDTEEEVYAVPRERHLHWLVRRVLVLVAERVLVLGHRPPLG